MNKNCYRIIFNKARGQLMVVAEIAVSRTKGVKNSRGSGAPEMAIFGLRPLIFCLWSALGMVGFSNVAQAQIIADNSAPSSQQATILNSANGVVQVNIQTPSAAGVSRNTYSQFDVDKKGAILNNSRTSAQTQIGGWVQGNPWLASGGARIILNEVNSSNPSQLNGYIEVAGTRAQVVIANPTGISCDGCGFINANRATLTTGTANFSGGSLTGYQVRGGEIIVSGSGMDATQTDYTDLISRSVKVNAGIWANNLKITTGTNNVDVDHTQATSIESSSATPSYGIDVAQLGGMYAEKITLIGTEDGLGVRNIGNIAASAGEIIVTAEGRIENSGSLSASSNIKVNSSLDIDNSGSVYAQKNVEIRTQSNILNSNIITAKENTTLAATGSQSQIQSTADSILGAGILADGSIDSLGDLTLNSTHSISTHGQNLSGGNQTIAAQTLDLSQSQVSASNLSLMASGNESSQVDGNVLTDGARIFVDNSLDINASKTLQTDRAILSAQKLDIHANDLSNFQGTLVQTGTDNLEINLQGDLDNTLGHIASNGLDLTLTADSIQNEYGRIQHAGLGQFQLNTKTINGSVGEINSNGHLTLNADTAVLSAGLTKAQKITIESDTLLNQGGEINQTGSGTANITANRLLDNTSGRIESSDDIQIDAGEFLNQGGRVSSSGESNLVAESLDNTNGQVISADALAISVLGNVDNQKGLLAANQSLSLSASTISNNQGTVSSVHNDVTIHVSESALDNDLGKIEASQTVHIDAKGVNNEQGKISASQLTINTQLQEMNNNNGELTATAENGAGELVVQSGAFNNNAGLVQATGALSIDTNGAVLTNTNSGVNAGIVGQSTVSLTTGDLENQSGYIASVEDLTISALQLNNSQEGTIESASNLTLEGVSLNNSGGLVQAHKNINIRIADDVNNANSQISSGESLSLSASNINNTQGELLAEQSLSLTSSNTLNNTDGLISSGTDLTLQDSNLESKTLQVTNTDGTVIANQSIEVNSAGLTGDGKLLSQGDISVKITENYLHTGLIKANNQLSIETSATLTNQSDIQSVAEVHLKAATIDNQANGQISANKVNLVATAANTLTNRGLINGQETFIDTVTLNNLGTGRIYGDHIAIKAITVNNLKEGAKSAVIAARDKLDIGTKTLTNRDDSLIFSGGDISIGGDLDDNKNAINKAITINNNSATIESSADLNIAAQSVNNTNDYLTITDQSLTPQRIIEYQGVGSGNRYLSGTPGVYISTAYETNRLVTPEGVAYPDWYKYDYTRTITESKITNSDPGKLLSGGQMTLNADNVLNDSSHIIAGGTLSKIGVAVINQNASGTSKTKDQGTSTLYYREERDRAMKGRDRLKTKKPANYSPAATVEEITLNTIQYEGNTKPVGTGTSVLGLNTTTVEQSAEDSNVSVSVPRNLTITPISEVVVNNSVDGVDTIIRTGGANIQLPNNSLFQTKTDPSASYLVETDPLFTNNQIWLSSDYILDQLEFEPTITQKRLGDGFYEQKLIKEQIAQLTGRRFLTGYASDEEQYQSLMNNSVEYAEQLSLRPGVALTADQMSQLTSNIVWMVEKEIVQADGSVQKALIPQLYVRGGQVLSGSIISGENIDLQLTGDFTNTGTIQGNQNTQISANNIQNLGGRISGRDVDLQAQTDLNHLGGKINAQNSLSALAGRDLTIATTTSTQTSSQGSRTNIANVAEISVTGGTGDVNLTAGRDISIKATKLQSQSSGEANIIAGRHLTLGSVTESNDQKIVWDSSNWLKESSTTETGSTIQTAGNLNLQAGQDISARAANVNSGQGDLNVIAGGDLTLTAGENSRQSSSAHKSKNSGLIESTEKSFSNLSETIAQITTFSGNNISLQGQAVSLTATDINAKESLNLTGKSIDIAAVNDSSSSIISSSSSDMLGSGSAKDTNLSSTNVASNLTGKDITITATEQSIQVTGSNINAAGMLALDSAKDINIQSGYEGSLNESHEKESGWFNGALFSETEDLEGKLVKADVQSNIQAGSVEINANKDLNLNGVNIQVQESLSATAENINITNAEREEKTYSKHTELTVGLGDVMQSVLRPDELIQYKDGKATITLAKAEYESADKVTTTTTVISSKLNAGNISLTAQTDQADDESLGNISITGADLTAQGDIDLTATNKVTVKEAKNTTVTDEKSVSGKAELKLVVKNEYAQIAVAFGALQQATSQLEESKASYDQYQSDLKTQQGQLAQLKLDLQNSRVGIEQVDIDEMEELVDDLKQDASFYQANIALSTVNLATKTTALAAQTAKAYASSITYGFNAGVELDIDAIEKQLAAYEESSVASNLTANNITINSGDKTTLQGTHLKADQNIDLNTQSLDILASADVSNSANSTDHKNINISYDVIGGPSSSASSDSSKATTKGIKQNNSTLLADNININTAETTTVEGATIRADDSLTLNTKNLHVASVQDSETTKSQSQGMSAGFGTDGLSSVGFNNSLGNSKQKTTVLTSLTGNKVTVNTQEHTSIKGATIAAVDKNGNDNAQLNLSTQTLTASSFNNTYESKSQSSGINASIVNTPDKTAETNSSISSIGIDFNNDRTNSKTKTLATLGQGNIQVSDSENSQTTLLNRDIQDNEVDIYNVSSHQGLSGSLDTNLLTEEGRQKIAKDFDEFGQNFQGVAQGLPEADHSNPIIAAIGKGLDLLSTATGGIIPSNGTNGGLLGNIPIYFGDDDNQHRVIGDENSKNVHIPGILNDEESSMIGARNLIGSDKTFQVWTNPTHGFFSDIIESAVDILNPIGLQTGISQQMEQKQQETKNMKIYPHSQGHLIAAEGARNTKNGHTYYTYGAPMLKEGDNVLFKSLTDTFRDDNGAPPEVIQKNDGDYVANPQNIFNYKTWSMTGHGTENYGASKLKKEQEAK